MMQKSLYFKILYFLLLYLGMGLMNLIAQSNPADLFDEFCADCHSIGEGDMKGPDLMGVERIHNEEWLLKFIHSSKTMIANGDKEALKIWIKFEKKNMPNTKLSDVEIKSIIQYIGSLNKNKVVLKVAKPSNGENLSQTGNSNQKIELISSKVDNYEAELQNLEKKLDLIIAYHKKSFSARITDEEIHKGKELFEGKRPFTYNAPACISCHNTYKIDTLNWNPSAYDIATTFSERNNKDMDNIIVNPISNKMNSVLKDHQLTNDESFYITAFLQDLEKTGLKEHKKIPKKLITFSILCLIMFLSLFDLLFTKLIKRRWINIITFFITLLFVSNTIIISAKNVGISKGYSPIQPIKFSHKIHVKENKINCIFCHNSPEFSRESGIPSTNVCMICHNKIKSGEKTGQFEINKIKQSFKKKKPIEWIKIHNLPDHVFFSHAQHVSVGKIECKTCHGAVEETNVTSQFSPLSMGWCINCHREKNVQFKENKFYSNYKQLHIDLKSGKIKKVTADKIGANDCQKCHY